MFWNLAQQQPQDTSHQNLVGTQKKYFTVYNCILNTAKNKAKS